MSTATAGEGLLGSLIADGTLARPSAPAPDTLWSQRFAQRTQRITASMIRELLKLTEKPDIISFAGGLPAPEVFPIEAIRAATERVLSDWGTSALQYTTTEGYRPLRELLVRHMSRYGVKVGPENVLITSGSQQALDLIGKLLINPGDRVLTEAPTYLGALQAFNAYQADYLSVPIDDDGMDADALDEQMRGGPKFIYALPNFQNPAGVTMSLPRRRRLVERASALGIPIVEDDPYGQLLYEGEHLPSLVSLDAGTHGCANGEKTFTGNVLYLSTLSKTLAPGLRIAWVVAPEVVISKLVQIKQGADLHTSTFCQYVAYEVARGGFLDRHVKVIRRVYGERRNAMLRALDRYAPPGVRWTKPAGGLFLWATLPEGFDTVKLLDEAIAEKVAFVPGAAFYPTGGGERTMRLNFSYAAPDVIDEGIKRLCRVVEKGAERLGRRWTRTAPVAD
ncbi:MAG TPA: PLP-dependent aminotransferase family protein [Thermoanaerobaculia bacterium]|nr:PLP-dependent aminotransferase family protein [Thermoanaerobaculia bacterium]